MASLTKHYSQEKLLGQVYTPQNIVGKILDDLAYNDKHILGKKIIDPACGDGRFLVEVVGRIIQFSAKENLEQNLSYVYGWDIDAEAIKLCRKNLDELIQDFDFTVDWKVEVKNSIKTAQKKHFPKFDFIVGNPPYVRIQHLAESERKYIQTHYKFCKKGSTDIYIAFYELAYKMLSTEGKCGFITPNTFFYTETAKDLRDFLVHQKAIQQITNYGHIQLFENATTYSAITILSKKSLEKFTFQEAESVEKFTEKEIDIKDLAKESIWRLSTKAILQVKGKKLSELANIHVGLTTLSDKSYVFSIENDTENADFVWANTKLKGKIKLEKAILKPIIKASKYKTSTQEIKEYILFPYQKIEGKNTIIPEKELQKNFPLAYEYLLSIKETLDKRDNGKPNKVAWYAFGRSQGLDTSFGKKIIFSPMNKKPNFVLSENEEATFYSGYCIKHSGDYESLLAQLNSERMEEFVRTSSRDFRGAWKAYSKKVIQDFVIDTKILGLNPKITPQNMNLANRVDAAIVTF